MAGTLETMKPGGSQPLQGRENALHTSSYFHFRLASPNLEIYCRTSESCATLVHRASALGPTPKTTTKATQRKLGLGFEPKQSGSSIHTGLPIIDIQ